MSLRYKYPEDVRDKISGPFMGLRSARVVVVVVWSDHPDLANVRIVCKWVDGEGWGGRDGLVKNVIVSDMLWWWLLVECLYIIVVLVLHLLYNHHNSQWCPQPPPATGLKSCIIPFFLPVHTLDWHCTKAALVSLSLQLSHIWHL